MHTIYSRPGIHAPEPVGARTTLCGAVRVVRGPSGAWIPAADEQKNGEIFSGRFDVENNTLNHKSSLFRACKMR